MFTTKAYTIFAKAAAKRAFNKFKKLEIRVPKNARRYILPPRFNDED